MKFHSEILQTDLNKEKRICYKIAWESNVRRRRTREHRIGHRPRLALVPPFIPLLNKSNIHKPEIIKEGYQVCKRKKGDIFFHGDLHLRLVSKTAANPRRRSQWPMSLPRLGDTPEARTATRLVSGTASRQWQSMRR